MNLDNYDFKTGFYIINTEEVDVLNDIANKVKDRTSAVISENQTFFKHLLYKNNRFYFHAKTFLIQHFWEAKHLNIDCYILNNVTIDKYEIIQDIIKMNSTIILINSNYNQLKVRNYVPSNKIFNLNTDFIQKRLMCF